MSRRNANPDDPRALIAEAYAMEGLTVEDARAIFFDWALGLAEGADAPAAARRLLVRHAGRADHPMTALLQEAAEGRAERRRGGWRARRSPD